MRCEAQIADFGYSGAEFLRAYARIPKPVSTGVENGWEVTRISLAIRAKTSTRPRPPGSTELGY